MKITIITLFPDMFAGFLNESIVKRAQEKGAVEINMVNLRDFALDSYGSVDDRPYGGGAGMVLRIEPVIKALEQVGKRSGKSKTILTSARGHLFNQKKAQEFSHLDNLIVIAGHYEATDERISDYIDEEVSIGDFVLTGGELPAAMIVDAVVRLLPKVLKKEEATEIESFNEVSLAELRSAVGQDDFLDNLEKNGVQHVHLLEYPQYTRPQEFEGKVVPEVLLSGDPKKIRIWQLQEAYKKTKEVRPDLLGKHPELLQNCQDLPQKITPSNS